MTSACETCRYYRAGVSAISPVRYKAGMGECRRHAPRGPVQLAWSSGGEDTHAHVVTLSPFPLVPADDWCGEHSSKD